MSTRLSIYLPNNPTSPIAICQYKFNRDLLMLLLLIPLWAPAQLKEGWVKANTDTLVYLTGVTDFNSSEIVSKTSVAEKKHSDFKFYLGEVVDYSTINGLTGLLTEWGASNAELSTLLNGYDYYLNQALLKTATFEQRTAFTTDNSFIRVVNSRHYFLELLKFAKSSKKDTYLKNLSNASFCLAFTLCNRETNRLLELRKTKIHQYVSDLNKNHIKASWVSGTFWIGGTGGGTFDEEMESKLKAYDSLHKELVAEIVAASKKIAKASVKIAKTNKGRFLTDRAKADFFLAVSKVVSPSSHAILSKQSNISAFIRYARDTSLTSLFDDFNTVVHEACHSVNFDVGYFISESISIPVVTGEVYNSHELIKVMPKEKYQSFFRNTYIFESSNLSSQVSGIYGLLDEFSAYYHGAKADWDIFTDKEKIIQKFPSYKGGMNQLAVTTWEAYYEFSVMMAWYLDFSKQKYTEQFKKIMTNKPLRVAYTLLNNRFSELVANIEKQNGNADAKLKALFVESTKTLSEFRFEKCTELNYKEYL